MLKTYFYISFTSDSDEVPLEQLGNLCVCSAPMRSMMDDVKASDIISGHPNSFLLSYLSALVTQQKSLCLVAHFPPKDWGP